MSTREPVDWTPPGHYGYASAIDGMGGVAAPFLAGIAIALAILVISTPEPFGAENVALFALVLAAVGLIGCAECTFVARRYVVTPSQLEEWQPKADAQQLADEQRQAAGSFADWASWARRLYNVGIVALACGVTAALVPESGICHMPAWRVAAFVLASAGAVVEVVAVVVTACRDRQARKERMRIELALSEQTGS
jgi:hypothetical protein